VSDPASPADARALAVFDALCERRVRDLVDAQLMTELTEALAAPGRAAELVTRFIAPARTRVLDRLARGAEGGKLADGIPAGVLELVIALLPSIPPPPRELVERAIGSREVRAEVRRMLEETVGELLRGTSGRGPRSRSVIGWGARAAASAGRNVMGAIGGALGADLEARIGDAVELGVSLAQRRIVDTASAPETARRTGKELARLVPRLVELPLSEVARAIRRLPLPMLDGLWASLIAHNSGRPLVRTLVADEAEAVITQLSETTIGELLDRFGARAPLRAAAGRLGGPVVAAIEARLATSS
jgi:hypothetical protein